MCKVDTSGGSCSDYKADGYECVPYYQCEDGEIIDDGAGLIDIRFVHPPCHPEFVRKKQLIFTFQR